MGNQASRPADAELSCAPSDPEVQQVLFDGAIALDVAAHGACTVIPLAIAARTAYWYGRKLALDPNPSWDPMHLRPKLEDLSKGIDSLIDRGCLKHYRIGGVQCLGLPGLPLEEVGQSQMAATYCTTFKKPFVLYKTKVVQSVQSRVHIAKEEIPAFLLDNGFPLMDAEELAQHLMSKLSKVLPITECVCVGKYSIKGKQVVGSLGSNNVKDLKAGEARYKIRIDEDFSKYTADPTAYEEKLKEHILESLGLDHVKIPGVKKHIKIEKVWEGSVWVQFTLGFGLVAAGALIFLLTYYAMSRQHRPNESKTPSPISVLTDERNGSGPQNLLDPTSPSSCLRRPLTHVQLRSLNDDDWEVVGYFHETPKCYLPDTLFRLPDNKGYKTASQLHENDIVVGIDGQQIRVMSIEVARRNGWCSTIFGVLFRCPTKFEHVL